MLVELGPVLGVTEVVAPLEDDEGLLLEEVSSPLHDETDNSNAINRGVIFLIFISTSSLNYDLVNVLLFDPPKALYVLRSIDVPLFITAVELGTGEEPPSNKR